MFPILFCILLVPLIFAAHISTSSALPAEQVAHSVRNIATLSEASPSVVLNIEPSRVKSTVPDINIDGDRGHTRSKRNLFLAEMAFFKLGLLFSSSIAKLIYGREEYFDGTSTNEYANYGEGLIVADGGVSRNTWDYVDDTYKWKIQNKEHGYDSENYGAYEGYIDGDNNVVYYESERPTYGEMDVVGDQMKNTTSSRTNKIQNTTVKRTNKMENTTLSRNNKIQNTISTVSRTNKMENTTLSRNNEIQNTTVSRTNKMENTTVSSLSIFEL